VANISSIKISNLTMYLVIRDPSLAHTVHYFFEWAALAVGAWIYRRQKARQGVGSVLQGPTFAVVIGCLLGAAIGNKAMFWLENPQLWSVVIHFPMLWLQGQSIVGGLLGGWMGVELAKWVSRWRGPRTGDDFVPAILGGILVGRIGCFLAGLNDGTYGVPTDLPWGMDLGDGIPRHPATLYEWLVALLALLTWPRWARALAPTPGLAFRCFMLGYMLWRLGVDSLKPVPYAYWGGMSGIQWVCLCAACVIAAGMGIDRMRGKQ
jgi:phosphatidylglycerol:prolipoprotein diacylglycerol transferase